jgi:hypothetical protein
VTTSVRFTHRLAENALHIDYLRVRCGREAAFKEWAEQRSDIGAYIAFSEWDVVLFTPTAELYPENLIKFYSGRLTDAIAGSAGYFNYVWNHPINTGWEKRLTDRVGLTSQAHMSMLVSLRFTDQFRSRLGIGAELLFCDFVERLLDEESIRGTGQKKSISAVIAHGLGWNDTTIVLKANKDHEGKLLEVLTRIRYCTESQCLQTRPAAEDPCIVAATYSHVLGDLDLYVAEKLSFGTLAEQVERARLLVRVNPTLEKSFRKTLETTFAEHRIEGRVGSELGHYNFSADLTEAFKELNGPDPVQIIQGFRRKIEEFMTTHSLPSTSFSETTTEITLKEDLSPAPVDPPAAEKSLLTSFLGTVRGLLVTPDRIEKHASKMTRHRLAILLGTIATYLEDPVRGSVAGHICRFLKIEFKRVLEHTDRAGQEDLCHILEYALNQATDGLSQFQHDANSLGLSGRGGYSRLIQAVEQYLHELLGSFDLDLMPLLTFGLRPAHEGMTLDYWIDIPFSTAFVPSRWYIVYHEVAHMCWSHIFGWRLDTFEVWNEYASGVIEINRALNDDPRDKRAVPPSPRIVDRKEFLQARIVVEEVFPNYLMLNVVTTGDLNRLDELMIARDLITTPRPILVRALLLRMILRAVLDLHQQWRPPRNAARIERFRAATKRAPHEKECIEIAGEWWQTWADIDQAFHASGPARTKIVDDLTTSIGAASENLRTVILKLQKKESFQRRDALYGAESLASLIADDVFTEDAATGARQVIQLLALRGADYARRAPRAFPQGDPSAIQFGYVLAKIDAMCDTARTTAETWMPGYAKVIEEGWVFADGPGETALSRFLADESMASSKDPLKPPPLISSLSAILSLWHVAATSLADAEGVGLDDLPKWLDDHGVVSNFSF